jgi:hypothetical protein
VSVKILDGFKKLSRREFGQVVHKTAEGNTAFYTVYKDSVSMLRYD